MTTSIASLKEGSSVNITAVCREKMEKTYNSTSGDKKMFILQLADDSGEVRGIGFGDAFESLFPIFEEGATYNISSVKVERNARYGDRLEVKFFASSRVTQSSTAIQLKQFTIEDAMGMAVNKQVDITAIVTDCGPLGETENKKKRRTLCVSDHTCNGNITVFGDAADSEFSKGQIICVKRAKISDYNGKTFTAFDPPCSDVSDPKTEALTEWWNSEGKEWGSASKLTNLQKLPFNARVTVFGVVINVGDIISLNAGTSKRTIIIADPSNVAIEVSLFKDATECELKECDMIRLVGAKLTSWNEISLSVWSKLEVEILSEKPTLLSSWADSIDEGGFKALPMLADKMPKRFLKVGEVPQQGRCNVIGTLKEIDDSEYELSDDTGSIPVKFVNRPDVPKMNETYFIERAQVQEGNLVLYGDTPIKEKNVDT